MKLDLWQSVAFVSCLIGAALWIGMGFVMKSESLGTVTNCLLLAAILGIGAVASVSRATYVMYAVFAVAFLPAGLLTLGAKNEAMLIGILNLAFLVATIQMHRVRER